MNVNLYVYERKKCTLMISVHSNMESKMQFLQQSAGIRKCEKYPFANHFCLLKKFWKCERFLCLATFSRFLSTLSEQSFEDGVSPDASFRNAVLVRKGHFYRHFFEQDRSPCKTVSGRGAARHQKGNQKNTLRDQIG